MKQLEEIFTRHQRQLYVIALAITRNRQTAEDAVHDSILAVAQIYPPPRDLKAYLFRSIRNKALHAIKRDSREEGLPEEEFLVQEECSNEERIFLIQVKRHLQELNSNERQVLIMKLFADLTFLEIAEITENSQNTVASWYRRGLERLQEKLDED